MSRDPTVEAGLQEIVDALSVRLGRPVVVDDVDLRPLAYSIQFGALDSVRTESILGRTAPDAARSTLFGHGIRTALDPVYVGEGDPIGELSQAASSHRRALAALRVAVDCGQDVARWEELRAYRLLTAMPASAPDDIPAALRGLLAGGHEQLVLTLETYLDHAGDVKRTAAELWLHRTSLYYRLRRIEEVAGVDLNRGEDRLLCHVALRLSRLAQSA